MNRETPAAGLFTVAPEPGQAMPVAEGVFWIRMPLPFKLDHVNVWLLRDGEGWAIVDTGIDSSQTRALWGQILTEATGDGPVTRVIATHYHPDHVGLAGWLCASTDAPLWMSQTEWLYARMLTLDVGADLTRDMVAFYRRAGCAEPFMVHIAERGPGYAPLVSPVPTGFHRLREGEMIEIGGRRWRILVGRGHAPEHVSLYAEDIGVLIAGDQVLPRISPNIGVYASEPEANPLADYLETLVQFNTLPADTLVLPSHHAPFRGLHQRVGELAAHHEARLDQLRSACAAGPRTAMALTQALFPRALDLHQTTFAVGETLAHLHLLMAQGEVRRTLPPDGVYLYCRAG
jgi:glyoxylase-like metal-dependent hydrolase (beta-lactamase superfamily II)